MAKKSQALLESNGPPNVVTDDKMVAVAVQPCGAWCFILGASVGAFCTKDKGHEDPHETKISVYVEPISEFVINWTVSKGE